ncbi:Hypothetical predicted protein, partial [Pelobates cultripes]
IATMWEILEWPESYLYTPPYQTSHLPRATKAMGRKTQKTPLSTNNDTQDIGAMLQLPTVTKMAPEKPEGQSDHEGLALGSGSTHA